MDRSIPDWIVEHGVCIAEIRLKAIIIDQTGERGIYMDERLKKQLDFILEADKVKNIMRQTYLADGKRKENDAEHSWHLALMAVLLSEYSNEEVDLKKVVPMVLIHDLVEIDAGDTYAYDEAGARQTAFLECFRKIRADGSGTSGTNLRHMRVQTPNLHTCLITASRFF